MSIAPRKAGSRVKRWHGFLGRPSIGLISIQLKTSIIIPQESTNARKIIVASVTCAKGCMASFNTHDCIGHNISSFTVYCVTLKARLVYLAVGWEYHAYWLQHVEWGGCYRSLYVPKFAKFLVHDRYRLQYVVLIEKI